MDLAPHAGRGREIVFETRGFESDEDARQAFWGDPGINGAGRQGAARHRLPRRHPARRSHDALRVRARHHARAGRLREGRRSLRPGHLRRLLDQARRRVPDDVAPARPASRRPAPRQPRPRPRHAGGDAAGTRLRDAAPPSRTPSSTPRARTSTRGSTSSPGLHGAGNRPSKVVEAGPVVDTGLQWLDERRGFPNFLYVHTMDPHVPYSPPVPFDRKYEPHPTPDHPGQDPRYDFKEPLDRDRLIAQYDGEIAYGDQEFGRFVDELKSARPLRSRAHRLHRRSRRGVRGPRQVAARAQRVRRARPHPPAREVPGAARRRTAHRAAGADAGRTAHRPRALRAARARRPRDHRPSPAGRGGGAAPRSRPRSRRSAIAGSSPTGCGRAGTSTSSASARRRTSSTSTCASDPKEQHEPLGPEPRARAAAQGGGRGGHGPQPVPLQRALRGPGHVPDAVQDGRLDRRSASPSASGLRTATISTATDASSSSP